MYYYNKRKGVNLMNAIQMLQAEYKKAKISLEARKYYLEQLYKDTPKTRKVTRAKIVQEIIRVNSQLNRLA